MPEIFNLGGLTIRFSQIESYGFSTYKTNNPDFYIVMKSGWCISVAEVDDPKTLYFTNKDSIQVEVGKGVINEFIKFQIPPYNGS